MSDDLETRRYLIKGRVQGVGFRWFVEREAATLGVTGLGAEPRRRPGGSDGHRHTRAAHALHGRLREGPRAARVDEVAVSPAPFLEAKSFGIGGSW